jgi:small subunit ribosomal protein S11
MLYSKSEMAANSTRMKAGSKLDKFPNFQKRGKDGKYRKVEKNFRRVTHQKSIKKIPFNTPFSRYLSRLTPFLLRNSSRSSVTSKRDITRDVRRDARTDGLHPLHFSKVLNHSLHPVHLSDVKHRSGVLHPLHPLDSLHPKDVQDVQNVVHSAHSVHSVHSKNVMNVINAMDVQGAQGKSHVIHLKNVRGVQGGKGARGIENVVHRNSFINPGAILKRRKTGIVSITATGNNTLLTLSDGKGRLRGSVSAGSVGFRNSAKSGLAGAEKAAARLIQKAREAGFLLLRVEMRGISFTKLKALRFMVHTPLPILDIVEKTTRSHNGCRLPRKRRL